MNRSALRRILSVFSFRMIPKGKALPKGRPRAALVVRKHE